MEKIEKVEMAETREVRRGFTFLTDFSQKFVLDHANSQMYQSHKTLRLRREMSLPLTFIRPFRDNPQSCPLNYQRVLYCNILEPNLSFCIDSFAHSLETKKPKTQKTETRLKIHLPKTKNKSTNEKHRTFDDSHRKLMTHNDTKTWRVPDSRPNK